MEDLVARKYFTTKDAGARTESTKTSTIQQNEMLRKELDDAKEQIEVLRKQLDDVFSRIPPPSNPPAPEPEHRHGGTRPLPQSIDWSFSPRVMNICGGKYSVWRDYSHTGWRYRVTVPSFITERSGSLFRSDTVYFGVQVSIQSPEGISTTQIVGKSFNEFLRLYSELKKEFIWKKLAPPPPSIKLLKMRNKNILIKRMCALDNWMQVLLSDIDVSRADDVAIFLKLKPAARKVISNSNKDQLPSNSNLWSRKSLHDNISATAERFWKRDAAVNLQQLNVQKLAEYEYVMRQIKILQEQQDEVELKSNLVVEEMKYV